MKELLILCVLFSYKTFAQLPIDSTTHLITYSEVVNENGSKDELYSRAREWFAKTYNSAQNVIQMDDKDKIVGKALMQVYHKAFGKDHISGYINYTISIYFKDGKYKYEITNFYHTGEYIGDGYTVPDFGSSESMINSKKKIYQKTFTYYLSQLDKNVNILIAGLKQGMSKKSSTAKDW